MKKIFRLFAAFAATTFAFSCMEEANPETPATGNGGSSYDGPMITLDFSVDELTRTSYDKENGHQWSEGDQIKIIWGTEENACTIAEVVNGYVSAEVGVADTYYAVYPETTAYAFTTPEGAEAAQLTVAIPQTQDGSFKQANLMAAKTNAGERCFAFKNLTHIFKFTLSEDSAYKGFQFMTNSSTNTYITGAVSVSFDEFAISAPSKLKIGETTYNASSIVQVGDLLPGGTYYVGMYPGVDMSYGFGFKATKQAGTTGWSEGALLMGAVDTDRLKITSITNLDQAIRPNIFFKETAAGKGDGSSWENAGDVNLLVKLLDKQLAPDVTYNKNTNGWRLYGAKLHFAAGTYEFPQTIAFQINVNNKTAVYGGYPTNLTGTSLEGRDPAAYETILTKDGGSRLFSGNGSTLYDWIWDGLTFTNNSKDKVSTDRGGIFYFNGSTKGTLMFKNCIFKNVKSTSGSGGAIFDFNTGTTTFKATFENCEFSNNENTAGNGGAILVESGSDAVIKFVNCDFTANKVTGSNKCGGAIYSTKDINATFENCNFSNNMSSGDGGAIYNTASSMTFQNCEFTSNQTTAGNGAVIYNNSDDETISKFVNCDFTSNTVTGTNKCGGAIYNNASTVIVDNCSFVGNETTTGSNADGGAIYSVDASSSAAYTGAPAYLYVYNSYFKQNKAKRQGAVRANGLGYAVIVNSTFVENTHNGNGDIFIRSDYSSDKAVKAYIINCTLSDGKLYNQNCNCYCYNSVFKGYYPNGSLSPYTEFHYSIFTEKTGSKDSFQPGVYGNNVLNEEVTNFTDNLFGTFTNGVVPVGGAALTYGMSSTALAALAADIKAVMPEFDATKLTVDQKGKSREGKTIMGAYVGE